MRAQAASLSVAPGRWLGPLTAPPARGAEQAQQQQQQDEGSPVYGLELTADQWDPLGLHQPMQVRRLGIRKGTCRSERRRLVYGCLAALGS